MLLLLSTGLFAQCEYTEISSFPFSETFCHERLDCSFTVNPYPLNHPTNGCWGCINNPHYYVISPVNDMYVIMNIVPDLNSHNLNNMEPQVPGFILFDGCPDDGGGVITHPWSYSGGECWDWGVMDVYCGWSQSVNAPNLNQGCVTATPWYPGLAHEVEIGFNLVAGEEYWFCVYPQGGCPPWTNTCTWGCIDVSFSGPNFLSSPDPTTPDEGITEGIIEGTTEDGVSLPRFRKIHTHHQGVIFFDTQTGDKYDVLMRKVN